MGMGKGFMEVPLIQPSKGYHILWRLLFLDGIQEMLGHKDVKTTMVYTQVPTQGPKGVRRRGQTSRV